MKRALAVGMMAAVIAVAAYILRPRARAEEEPAAPEPTASSSDAPRHPPTLGEAPTRPGAGDSNNDGRRLDAGAPSGERQAVDHRGEAPTQPRPRRPGEPAVYTVQAQVIASLRRSLRGPIKRCSQASAADLEPNAVLQGKLTVAVKGGVLTVIDVVVTQRGVPESSPIIECARSAFASAQVSAEGHPDVDKHTLRFPFKLPIP